MLPKLSGAIDCCCGGYYFQRPRREINGCSGCARRPPGGRSASGRSGRASAATSSVRAVVGFEGPSTRRSAQNPNRRKNSAASSRTAPTTQPTSERNGASDTGCPRNRNRRRGDWGSRVGPRPLFFGPTGRIFSRGSPTPLCFPIGLLPPTPWPQIVEGERLVIPDEGDGASGRPASRRPVRRRRGGVARCHYTAEYIEQRLGGIDDPDFDAEQLAACSPAWGRYSRAGNWSPLHARGRSPDCKTERRGSTDPNPRGHCPTAVS